MQDDIYILPAPEAAGPRRSPAHNLPAQLTPLIGREQEVAAACTLLRRPEVRLVTFTGTGGVGKTRLALQVATDLLDEFANGVCFVSLAPLSDPDLVIPTIAQAFDLKESATRPLLDLLTAFLQDKYLLLVLDNFEQILPAAPHLIDLLTSCAHLSILVTSRASLHVQGEHEFPVPPLALPDLTHLPTWEALSQYAAVALFLQRSQAVRPEFQLTPANASAIAAICTRLDGLPLAIELAAARIKLLSPQALLARLTHRLHVLTGGTQDAPTRQQTLRNTIDWSYHLLTPSEQRLFRRLSVFVGGCTLEAIEAVCAALDTQTGRVSVLDAVASLIDKSLLRQSGQEAEVPRFAMLETIREYGLEMLTASGEVETARHAHAVYCLALAESAEPELSGLQQALWFDRIEQEHDNLRAALQWLLERAEDRERIEMALRLGGALFGFWFMGGYRSEGWIFLEQALASSEGAAVAVRAKALWAAGHFASPPNLERAEALCRESLALGKQVSKMGNDPGALGLLAQVFLHQGNTAMARSLIEESLAIWKEIGDKSGIIDAAALLARVEANRGDHATARALYEESLARSRDEWNYQWEIASYLEGLAAMVAAQGESTWAARLWGTAETLRMAVAAPMMPVYRADYECSIAAARAQLGEQIFAAAWTEGRSMSLEQVLVTRGPVTLPSGTQPTPPAKSPPTYPDDLTAREVEVLRLLAQGLTDAQIATHLVIAPRTVNTHLTSIYGKIRVSSRSAATRYAIDHKLT